MHRAYVSCHEIAASDVIICQKISCGRMNAYRRNCGTGVNYARGYAGSPVQLGPPGICVSPNNAMDQPKKDKSIMDNAHNQLASFTQANIDAIARANAAIARGIEHLSKNFVSVVTRSVDGILDARQGIATSKSIVEVIEFQTKFSQEAWETIVAESRQVQDLSTSIVMEASAPIVDRFKAALAIGTATIQAVVTTSSASSALRPAKQAA